MAERTTIVFTRGDELLQEETRRRCLGALGARGTMVFLTSMFATSDANDTTGTQPASTAALACTLDLATEDGILNYSYALEQVEVAFYGAAVASPGFFWMPADEQKVIMDHYKQEMIHRESIEKLLGHAAIPQIAFSPAALSVLTARRFLLLRTAQMLEDTGVLAYNGAGKHLTDRANAVIATIVSDEVRNAAAIRALRYGPKTPSSFSVVTPSD
jgi:hypothetical protein